MVAPLQRPFPSRVLALQWLTIPPDENRRRARMPEPHTGSVTRPATGPSRRLVLLSVLIALGFVSGVGVSQDEATETSEVLARFDGIDIDRLPLHDDTPPDGAWSAEVIPSISSAHGYDADRVGRIVINEGEHEEEEDRCGQETPSLRGHPE